MFFHRANRVVYIYIYRRPESGGLGYDISFYPMKIARLKNYHTVTLGIGKFPHETLL